MYKLIVFLFLTPLLSVAQSQQTVTPVYFNSNNLINEGDSVSIYCDDCNQLSADVLAKFSYYANIQGTRPAFEKILPVTIEPKDTVGMDTAANLKELVTGYVFINAQGMVTKAMAVGSNAASRLLFIANVALPYKYEISTNLRQIRVRRLQKILKERYVRLNGVVEHQFFWDDYKEEE